MSEPGDHFGFASVMNLSGFVFDFVPLSKILDEKNHLDREILLTLSLGI